MSNEDLLADDFFAPEPQGLEQGLGVANKSTKAPWRVLVVDDEPQVHQVTKMALQGFQFQGRELDLISAYSGQEARAVLEQQTDIALVLLDVVMETETSGLDLAKWIREQARNTTVRIILRTGQPGQAPEKHVIRDYDINDYKSKTDLTVQKLYTLMYTALRTFEHVRILERSKAGMEEVIKATRNIIGKTNFINFAQATLDQLMTMLNLDDAVVVSLTNSNFTQFDQAVEVICASGSFQQLSQDWQQLHQLPFFDKIQSAAKMDTPMFGEHDLLILCGNRHHPALFYLISKKPIEEMDRNLMSLFAENMLMALENTILNEQMRTSQKEIIYRLTEVVENRSLETGNHVKRVAQYCYLLARLAGLDEAACQSMLIAAPLHDIGKVGTPDHILHKPGKLTAEEWTVMQRHAQEGERILSGSELPLLQTGALIAGYHHERWDGKGYPQGLEGEAIPIEARITCVADVFDALSSKRCYKEPWSVKEIKEYFVSQQGGLFDPELCQLFLDNFADFARIRYQLRDNTDINMEQWLANSG